MLNGTRLISILVSVLCAIATASAEDNETLTTAQLESVQSLEQRRIETIEQVIGSVIAIYGEERQGGGSGVIIDPTGIGLTNHHVIMGAGTSGWGGLADGNMYRWKLIGTDPGGDVAIIQMEGKDTFPFTPLADSDRVQVGDWALAMGNPFVLTEDQSPTVTLGIVSGVKRYQPGAGKNQLVYGNCIQTDSSINPGNSGGPLFNMDGQVIGINGRGSFLERGRVNVGLGYAISANQIRNFIPELLATKLVEHGTLDANFEDRDGKIVCSNLFEDSRLYRAGVRPGDELLEFEGESIESANQFTNLICTLPENWPATLTLRSKSNGQTLTVHLRLYGLPYAKPEPPQVPKEDEQTPEQKEQLKRVMEMVNLLSAPPGTIRLDEINRQYVRLLMHKWRDLKMKPATGRQAVWKISDTVSENGSEIGSQTIWLVSDGRFKVTSRLDGQDSTWFWDGETFSKWDGENYRMMSLVEAKLNQGVVQALGIATANRDDGFDSLGTLLLDGSDKVQSRNAWRFRITDSDDDRFYFWLGSRPQVGGNSSGLPEMQLLKAAADENSEQKPGGILFEDWQLNEGLQIARVRKSVLGLAETQQRKFSNETIERDILSDDDLEQRLNFPPSSNDTGGQK